MVEELEVELSQKTMYNNVEVSKIKQKLQLEKAQKIQAEKALKRINDDYENTKNLLKQ